MGTSGVSVPQAFAKAPLSGCDYLVGRCPAEWLDKSVQHRAPRHPEHEGHHQLGQELKDVWLERAMAWAQRAQKRGNAWTASVWDPMRAGSCLRNAQKL